MKHQVRLHNLNLNVHVSCVFALTVEQRCFSYNVKYSSASDSRPAPESTCRQKLCYCLCLKHPVSSVICDPVCVHTL